MKEGEGEQESTEARAKKRQSMVPIDPQFRQSLSHFHSHDMTVAIAVLDQETTPKTIPWKHRTEICTRAVALSPMTVCIQQNARMELCLHIWFRS